MHLACALALVLGCRIERVSPHEAARQSESTQTPHGELWVYTSAFSEVVDELDALARKALPQVNVKWFKAGSEKVASRIEGELAGGGTKADVLLVSDPFLYERYKEEGLFIPYVPPVALRMPRSLVDLDGMYSAARISTMVLAFKESRREGAPQSFADLVDPKWKGQLVIGDPIASGTAFTWAAFMEAKYGKEFFRKLRDNKVSIGGGTAAVQARIESGEALAGVILLESILVARRKGADLAYRIPADGAVVIPGYAAIFKSTRNPTAAKAFFDLLLSTEGQQIIVGTGAMHSPDPRLPGPDSLPNIDKLLELSQQWTETFLQQGTTHSAEIKQRFAEAFAK